MGFQYKISNNVIYFMTVTVVDWILLVGICNPDLRAMDFQSNFINLKYGF